MASNGAVDVLGCEEEMEGDREVRSVAEPRRSAAAPTTPDEVDWTCEALYSLYWTN